VRDGVTSRSFDGAVAAAVVDNEGWRNHHDVPYHHLIMKLRDGVTSRMVDGAVVSAVVDKEGWRHHHDVPCHHLRMKLCNTA
jgi:hypothetical protein